MAWVLAFTPSRGSIRIRATSASETALRLRSMPICSTSVVGFAQAGGVDDVDGHAVEGDLFAHGVAGGAGDVGYDGDVVARQGVEQAGFADVGRADEDDVHAFAQNRALFRTGEHGFQTALQGLELAVRVGGFEKVDVFFGEV